MHKKISRQRRARRPRAKIRELGVHRLCIHRTPRHIYVQLIAPSGSEVLASASTLDPEIRKEVTYGGNVAAAKVVGRIIAERSLAVGIERVACDRSGFRFHGRVKALADAAREQGLKF
jgi:large subunit ribosomal protein L18